jgi:hypothetical protein
MELSPNHKLDLDTKSTFGLNVEQLADLFSLTLEERDSSQDDCLDQRIRNELSRQLSVLTFENSLLYQVNTDSSGDRQCLTQLLNRPLGDMIGPESRVDQLRLIKNYSKRARSQSVSAIDISTATAIYYAAIACALVYHDELITRHAPDVLTQAFSQLSAKEWLVSEFAALFEKASQKCRTK